MIALVNGREKEMLPTLQHDQLVHAAFGNVDVGGYTVRWGLHSPTGDPVKSVGGFVLPGVTFDLEQTTKRFGADVQFDVSLT